MLILGIGALDDLGWRDGLENGGRHGLGSSRRNRESTAAAPIGLTFLNVLVYKLRHKGESRL